MYRLLLNQARYFPLLAPASLLSLLLHHAHMLLEEPDRPRQQPMMNKAPSLSALLYMTRRREKLHTLRQVADMKTISRPLQSPERNKRGLQLGSVQIVPGARATCGFWDDDLLIYLLPICKKVQELDRCKSELSEQLLQNPKTEPGPLKTNRAEPDSLGTFTLPTKTIAELIVWRSRSVSAMLMNKQLSGILFLHF